MQENLGLYRPEFEHDACGIGCVVQTKGVKSHQLVQDAIDMLENMEHRGGTGADPETGDGAGIMIQVPHDFLRIKCLELGFELPSYGHYGVVVLFMPQNSRVREECRMILEKHADELNLKILGYRKVPVDRNVPGAGATRVEPVIEQVFIFHRRAYVQRTREETLCAPQLHHTLHWT